LLVLPSAKHPRRRTAKSLQRVALEYNWLDRLTQFKLFATGITTGNAVQSEVARFIVYHQAETTRRPIIRETAK
jgi:hypothetical protein